MQYLLVQNKQIIHLGPVDWKPRFIQSEFNELFENEEISFKFQVPPVEQGYIDVGEGFEIFPITNINSPEIDTNFEQPVGPFYTYNEFEATAVYEKTDKNIVDIKNTIKTIAAAERYKKEIAGTKAIIQNTEVTIDTSREGRAIFVQAYTTMLDDTVIGWKFPECWLDLSKNDLASCVNAGITHIQEQFAWEKAIDNQVSDSNYIEELKTIYNSMFPIKEEGINA